MAATRTRKGEESRSRLLHAATTEFARLGYHATKVSDIVAAAGLSQAAFYLYFTSKEAVFTELIAEFRGRLQVLADAGKLATHLSPESVPDQVRANVLALLQLLMADATLTRIALFLAPDGESIRDGIAALIMANLQANQAAGIIRPDLDVAVGADAMVGLLERLLRRWLKTGEGAPESLASAAADVIMYGILNREVL
ncbi:MAG TPA: helix-turn-helix domain-containing protein [Symbiobacteriaceae bacterium]|nr:helix-turn-helix domain-containing protein [Symbiobacteriaceae bacterium]